jgi:uncharacterized protein YcbX
MHVSALNIHPVKSLRAVPVDSFAVDALGPVGDRRFLAVTPEGLFLTQRTVPAMAQVTAVIDDDQLVLQAAGAPELRVRREADPAAPLATVSVWKSTGLQAEDCGEAAAAWLSQVLGGPTRLVRVGADFRRPVLKPRAHAGDVTAFGDSCPFLAISEASLADLNRRMEEQGQPAVPMNRFRTNLVVSGCAPNSEDTRKRIQIGDVVLRSVGPCARCIITTTDQATGSRGVEPLRTLAQYRRDPDEPSAVNFGQNLVNESKVGRIRVGDAVVVLE